MNKTLCAILLLSAMVSFSNAQSVRSVGKNSAPLVPTPPPYCHPCLFYGGDLDPTGPGANGLLNTKSRAVPDGAAVYVPFVIPEGTQWVIEGLFANVDSEQTVIDPPVATYYISRGVSSGGAGTLITTGDAPATYTPTGRALLPTVEYTVLVSIPKMVLQSGTYWMAVVPHCTEHGDSQCSSALYWLSDVEDVPPPNHVGFEPWDDSFWDSEGNNAYYSPTWGVGGGCNDVGCDRFSAGVIGVVQKSD
jgi:hypothetical protein